MHPAHTLPQNEVTVGAGVSGHFALGDADEAIAEGRSAAESGGPTAGEAEQRLIEGAVANTVLSPGISPWVGGRVGLGHETDAGLTYAGRTVRLDARHAFEARSYALSIGLGASGVLLRPGSDPPPGDAQEPGAGRIVGSVDDIDATGWGLDVPLIAGWRSTGDVVMVWMGARGGFEMVAGNVLLSASSGTELTAPLDGRRWFLGGLFGLAIGFEPFWVGLQLDASYESGSGTVEFPEQTGAPARRDADVSGVTITPTGALVAKF